MIENYLLVSLIKVSKTPSSLKLTCFDNALTSPKFHQMVTEWFLCKWDLMLLRIFFAYYDHRNLIRFDFGTIPSQL